MKSCITTSTKSHYLLLAVVFIVQLLSGCQTPPMRSITEQELVDGRQNFLQQYQSALEAISNKAGQRIAYEYKRVHAANDTEPQDL